MEIIEQLKREPQEWNITDGHWRLVAAEVRCESPYCPLEPTVWEASLKYEVTDEQPCASLLQIVSYGSEIAHRWIVVDYCLTPKGLVVQLEAV